MNNQEKVVTWHSDQEKGLLLLLVYPSNCLQRDAEQSQKFWCQPILCMRRRSVDRMRWPSSLARRRGFFRRFRSRCTHWAEPRSFVTRGLRRTSSARAVPSAAVEAVAFCLDIEPLLPVVICRPYMSRSCFRSTVHASETEYTRRVVIEESDEEYNKET